MTPLAIEYHANGFVETGSELEEVGGRAVLSGGDGRTEGQYRQDRRIHANRNAKSLGPNRRSRSKRSKIPKKNFPRRRIPTIAQPHGVNKNFPDGLQHGILISNELKGIHFEFEGEPCEEWGHEEGPEGKAGSYTGSFPQFLQAGNLEFK